MINIVWFKRDLRIRDNEPLHMATKSGKVLPLYVLEPELWQQPDMSRRQYMFLVESLKDLNNSLQKYDSKLIIKVGDAQDVFEQLCRKFEKYKVWSHEETWNEWTYERDKKLKKYFRKNDIQWQEFQRGGVIRRLKDRDGWAARWYKEMEKEIIPVLKTIDSIEYQSDKVPSSSKLGLEYDACEHRQAGGEKIALEILDSFLHSRGEGYTKEMSSPVTAFESCSRLSPYLAFGNISMRQLYQITKKRFDAIKDMPRGTKGKWSSAMRSFMGRLRWHCHFMQKLEDEPEIEFENMNRLYDGLREDDFNEEFFTAWKEGKTGYPMVDACMRCLVATGWMNFRMRAMLMSFASYHLWLHWREPSLYLARMFTDYEPGIHYSQCQMQAGTTGINSIRIYNPIKQGIDQDPDGVFIREWIEELKEMPDEFIHTPWKAESLMNGYPIPIVDEKTARKSAADKIYALRKQKEHRETAKQIFKKHGSRRRPQQRSKPNKEQGILPI